MAQPENKERVGNIEVVDWGKESFTIQKSWKPKDSDEWKNEKLNLFKSELEKLALALEKIGIKPGEGKKQ